MLWRLRRDGVGRGCSDSPHPAGEPDIAGQAGEGTPYRRHQRHGSWQRIPALFCGTLQPEVLRASGEGCGLTSCAASSDNEAQRHAWHREQRYVGAQLTFHYDRRQIVLEQTELSKGLAGKYVELFDFADRPLEVRWNGKLLPYRVFSKDQRVTHTAVVENKRLGHARDRQSAAGHQARAEGHDQQRQGWIAEVPAPALWARLQGEIGDFQSGGNDGNRQLSGSRPDFLNALIQAVPYKIHTVLTDNGVHFTTPSNRCSAAAEIRLALQRGEIFRAHAFEFACAKADIDHRLTKPKHPWTNGQVERMNRTIKEATVKRFYYETYQHFRQHLTDFVSAYHFARRPKTLKGLPSYEYICSIWTKEPQRFNLNPIHLSPGPNK